MKTWSAADAKRRFARLIKDAMTEPQLVESRGKPVGVVVSYETYTRNQKVFSQQSLARWLEELKPLHDLEGRYGTAPAAGSTRHGRRRERVTYLLDTNVVSEVMRRSPNPGVAAWFSALDAFSVSAVTLEELVYGLRRRTMLAKEAWLRRMLADKADVVPVTSRLLTGAAKSGRCSNPAAAPSRRPTP